MVDDAEPALRPVRENDLAYFAQRRAAGYLFATYPTRGFEASTDVTSIAERRSLERAGFRAEGVLRGIGWRAGEWHDMAVYGRLRADP